MLCDYATSNSHNYQNPESRTLVPGIAFEDFARRFREPSLDEGFQDIVRVKFRFQGSEAAKKLWSQYWI
ncbi:Polynucleotide [Aspergillus sclerotialis]|uniref:Polynucleotide n=1 Tax=Aspergillus sclerotialis TaxID=2070753 RepID=A0A3A2ZYV2_9EURO|nr:Polynucleotide [Aspergillus sclerotialis]